MQQRRLKCSVLLLTTAGTLAGCSDSSEKNSAGRGAAHGGGAAGGGVSGATNTPAEGGASSGGAIGEVTVSFDLGRYDGSETPSSLSITNETLAFPLMRMPGAHVLTASDPGDLVVANTRVGCGVDPDRWIGTMGVVPVDLRPAPAALLILVTIDQDIPDPETTAAEDLAQATCLTFRTSEGTWQPFLRPSAVVSSPGSVRTEFSLNAPSADAAALFLPTYTYVTRLSYTLGVE